MPFTTEELAEMEGVFSDPGGFAPEMEEMINSIHTKIVALQNL